VTLRHYIGPWEWRADDAGLGWHAPVGTVGTVDLRPVTLGESFGYFVTDGVALPSEYTFLGEGRIEDIMPSESLRGVVSSALGVPIVGATLLDWLWYSMTVHADPVGAAFAKPIIPTHRGNIELHLGGHSLVRRERWRPDTPHRDLVLSVVRNDLAATVRDAEAAANLIGDRRGLGVGERQELQARALAVPGKVLGAALLKYGVPEEELQPDARKPIEVRTPETTLSDNFNRASLGSGWTVVDGAFQITSDQLDGPTSVATSPAALRFESDLSTADHEASVDLISWSISGESFQSGDGACRFSPSAKTMYSSFMRRDGVDPRVRVVVAGTQTLISLGGSGSTGPVRNLCRADGSTITITQDGTSRGSITNTAISGGLRAGICTHPNPTLRAQYDNWLAEDLLAPPTSQFMRIGPRQPVRLVG